MSKDRRRGAWPFGPRAYPGALVPDLADPTSAINLTEFLFALGFIRQGERTSFKNEMIGMDTMVAQRASLIVDGGPYRRRSFYRVNGSSQPLVYTRGVKLRNSSASWRIWTGQTYRPVITEP
jgi:hypothetical protein